MERRRWRTCGAIAAPSSGWSAGTVAAVADPYRDLAVAARASRPTWRRSWSRPSSSATASRRPTRSGSTGTPCSRELRRCRAGPRRRERAEPSRGPTPGARRSDGLGQVDRGAGAGRASVCAGRSGRAGVDGLDGGLPGDGHRHHDALRGRTSPCAAPPGRRRRPGPGVQRRRVRPARSTRRSTRSSPGALGPSSSAAPGCTCRRWSTGWSCRAATPRSRPASTREPDTRALYERLRASSTRSRRHASSPTTGAGSLRALEVTEGSGRPFSSFGPGLDAYPGTPFVLTGPAGRP